LKAVRGKKRINRKGAEKNGKNERFYLGASKSKWGKRVGSPWGYAKINWGKNY